VQFTDTPEEAAWRSEVHAFVQEFMPTPAAWDEYYAGEGAGGGQTDTSSAQAASTSRCRRVP